MAIKRTKIKLSEISLKDFTFASSACSTKRTREKTKSDIASVSAHLPFNQCANHFSHYFTTFSWLMTNILLSQNTRCAFKIEKFARNIATGLANYYFIAFKLILALKFGMSSFSISNKFSIGVEFSNLLCSKQKSEYLLAF